MLMFLLSFVTFLLLVFTYLQPDYISRIWSRFRGHLPPGPPSYPFSGSIMDKSVPVWMAMHNWGQTYGKICSLFLGTEYTVILTDKDVIRQALNNPVFDGRPNNVFAEQDLRIHGIGFAEGKTWKNHRRTAISTLKSLGVLAGKSELENSLLECTKILVEDLKSTKGKPFDLRSPFENASISALVKVIQDGAITSEFSSDRTAQALKVIFTNNPSVALINRIPWLRMLPSVSATANKVGTAIEYLRNMTQSNMRRREMEDPVAERVQPKDFIEAYRRQMAANEKDAELYTTKNLSTMAMEMLLAGSEDIVVVFEWLMIVFVNYPEIQLKCQQLVDGVVGRDRLPVLSDRGQLGYLEAVFHETMRFCNMVPYTLPRRAVEDTVFLNYHIPKDTIILANLYSVHFDEELWGDPFVFRPERFLDEEGMFVPNSLFVAFGIGRRSCVGETLSRMAFVCFIAALAQNFNFSMPNGARPPAFDDAHLGTALEPRNCQICAQLRTA